LTCIVGVKHREGVVMGADSYAGWETSGSTRHDPKLGRVGAYGIGFTTSYRMGQLLLYGFDPPRPPFRGDLQEFMVTVFVEAVRTRLRAGGWMKVENTRDEGGDFLVGVRGRLFTIYSDFSVEETVDRFAAVGCGEKYALGALAHLTCSPRVRVLAALRTAERFTGGVRGPRVVVDVPRGAR